MTTSKRTRVDSPIAVIGAGVVGGILDVVLAVALAALVFSGGLADQLVSGLGFFLFGTVAIGAVLGLTSGYPAMLGGPQDNTSAILAVAAAAMAAELAPSDGLATVIAFFAVASLVVAVVLVALGTLRLGVLVRFLPFPVVAGLLAGTGLLIVIGSVDLLVTVGGDGSPVPVWVSLVPGLAVTAALLTRTRTNARPVVISLMIAAAIAVTYSWVAFEGIGRGAAVESGLFLGPFPSGSLWSLEGFVSITGADWSLVAGQWVSLLTLAVLVPVTLLLYIPGFELALEHDLDGDRELRATGLANLAAAAGGGPPGFHYLSVTLLSARVGPPRRTVPLIAAALVAAVIVGGGPLLELLPTSAVAGLLLFIGMTFVLEWTWDARRRLPPIDLVVVALIAVTIGWFGLLVGAATGLLAAIALFVVRYSRVPVVRREFDGGSYRSRVDRSESELRFLDESGSSLLILELQAFLFFGTADRLRSHIVERIGRGGGVRFVVIGFRAVTGMDSSAVLAFDRLVALGEKHGYDVLFADVAPRIAEQLAPALGSGRALRAADVDRAVESCEDVLLAEGAARRDGAPADIVSYFAGVASGDDLVRLAERFEPRQVPSATRLMEQGGPSQGMYFIESGVVSVEIETADEGTTRLRTMGPGTIVGEMSLYLGGTCRATVVAQTPVLARQLTPEGFRRLRDEDPSAAAALHLHTTIVLSRRLEAADELIRSLLD